jgi:hypothetical protein
MRSRYIQVLLTLVLFAGVVAGLSFGKQWLTIPAKNGKFMPPLNSRDHELLQFAANSKAERSICEITPTRGHQHLWFENPNDEDVEIGLDHTSCKCTGVGVRVLNNEEVNALRDWLPIAAGAQLGASAGGLLNLFGPALLAWSRTSTILDNDPRWVAMEMEAEPEPIRIPGKAKGLIRIDWEGKKTGPQRMSAAVWVQPIANQNQRVYKVLEIPLLFVSPIMATPLQADINLGPGDCQSLDFWCWSATRGGFKLAAHEESSNSCFRCTCWPLVGQELGALKAVKTGEVQPSILSGYHVVVTVTERPNTETRLDLGTFERKIILTSPEVEFTPGMHEYPLKVRGRVQGEVTVGTETDEDQIKLGIYPISRGTSKTVHLETSKPGLRLKRIEQTPPFLNVHLKETGTSFKGTRYLLTVTVPPDRGYLPEDSAIILETIEQEHRKVHIPVVGTASIPANGNQKRH